MKLIVGYIKHFSDCRIDFLTTYTLAALVYVFVSSITLLAYSQNRDSCKGDPKTSTCIKYVEKQIQSLDKLSKKIVALDISKGEGIKIADVVKTKESEGAETKGSKVHESGAAKKKTPAEAKPKAESLSKCEYHCAGTFEELTNALEEQKVVYSRIVEIVPEGDEKRKKAEDQILTSSIIALNKIYEQDKTLSDNNKRDKVKSILLSVFVEKPDDLKDILIRLNKNGCTIEEINKILDLAGFDTSTRQPLGKDKPPEDTTKRVDLLQALREIKANLDKYNLTPQEFLMLRELKEKLGDQKTQKYLVEKLDELKKRGVPTDKITEVVRSGGQSSLERLMIVFAELDHATAMQFSRIVQEAGIYQAPAISSAYLHIIISKYPGEPETPLRNGALVFTNAVKEILTAVTNNGITVSDYNPDLTDFEKYRDGYVAACRCLNGDKDCSSIQNNIQDAPNAICDAVIGIRLRTECENNEKLCIEGDIVFTNVDANKGQETKKPINIAVKIEESNAVYASAIEERISTEAQILAAHHFLQKLSYRSSILGDLPFLEHSQDIAGVGPTLHCGVGLEYKYLNKSTSLVEKLSEKYGIRVKGTCGHEYDSRLTERLEESYSKEIGTNDAIEKDAPILKLSKSKDGKGCIAILLVDNVKTYQVLSNPESENGFGDAGEDTARIIGQFYRDIRPTPKWYVAASSLLSTGLPWLMDDNPRDDTVAAIVAATDLAAVITGISLILESTSVRNEYSNSNDNKALNDANTLLISGAVILGTVGASRLITGLIYLATH
jgi:hypothetical protein